MCLRLSGVTEILDRSRNVADRVWPIIDDDTRIENPSLAFTRDFISATDPDVIEFYGPKFQLYYTDREVRIAFGTSYNTYDPDDGGHLGYKYRYRAAVFLPLKTARELLRSLKDAIETIDDAESKQLEYEQTNSESSIIKSENETNVSEDSGSI
jgi:hypothetical protein